MACSDLQYEAVASDAADALRAEFGTEAYVHVERAPADRVFLAVVSDAFRELEPGARQTRLWKVLRDTLGDRAQRIALATAWAPGELV